VAPPTDNNFIYERNNRTVNTFVDQNPTPVAITTPPIVPDNRAEMFNRQFLDRQKEYENMLEKKAPADVNFREQIEDGVISNMDELIKKQLQDRETEFKLYSPPAIVPSPTGIGSPGVLPNANTPISSPTNSINNSNNIKFEQENPDVELLKKEVESLKNLVQDLANIIKYMNGELNILKSKFDFGENEPTISRNTSGIITEDIKQEHLKQISIL
jgi:hypothetical protein